MHVPLQAHQNKHESKNLESDKHDFCPIPSRSSARDTPHARMLQTQIVQKKRRKDDDNTKYIISQSSAPCDDDVEDDDDDDDVVSRGDLDDAVWL